MGHKRVLQGPEDVGGDIVIIPQVFFFFRDSLTVHVGTVAAFIEVFCKGLVLMRMKNFLDSYMI